MPRIAFIGVRISWLMLARNSLLAWVAISAVSRACFSSVMSIGDAGHRVDALVEGTQREPGRQELVFAVAAGHGLLDAHRLAAARRRARRLREQALRGDCRVQIGVAQAHQRLARAADQFCQRRRCAGCSVRRDP